MKKITILIPALIFLCSFGISQTTYSWRSEASNGNWNVDENWWSGSTGVPTGGEIINFDNNTYTSMTNNLSAANRHQILFSSSATVARTITGVTENTFYDFGGTKPKVENNSAASHILSFPIKIGYNPMEINPVSGDLSMIGNIDNNGNYIDIYGNNSNTLSIIGVISGTGGLSLKQNSTVELVSSNTYSGATTIEAGTLVIAGNLASSAITVQNGGTLTIEGSDVTVSSLTVESGGIVNISPNMGLTVSGNLANSGTVTINSDATGTGSLIVEGTPTGNSTIERYIVAWSDATHGWHFISSPVASQAIQPEFVPTTPTTSEDFYKWDESALSTPWINSESSSGVWNSSFESDFVEGGGYLAAYSTNQTKTFSGVLNTTDVGKASLSYTTGNSNTGWHLLGNPYASALYWNKTTWSLTNIDATAKIWVESSASYTDIAATTGIIPAMQGFMVHVNASTGSLTIDAADRTHNTQAWYKDTEVNKIKLTAYDTEGSTAQTSTIRVVDNATTGFDSEFDSKFLPGYAPQFYSVIADGNLSTNVIPEITSALTIPLSFVKNSSNNYYIEVEGINSLEPQEMVYLTDNKINHTQLLNDNPIYEFTSEEDDFAERFILHFSPLSINDIPIDQLVKAYATEGKVEIRSSKPIDAKINIFNISGQLINTSELNNESYAILNISNYKGPAIVSVTTTNQVLSKKVIIW